MVFGLDSKARNRRNCLSGFGPWCLRYHAVTSVTVAGVGSLHRQVRIRTPLVVSFLDCAWEVLKRMRIRYSVKEWRSV